MPIVSAPQLSNEESNDALQILRCETPT